jgi:hypothetical protein
MKKTALKSLLMLALAALIIIPALGCRKKGDTIVRITVKDEANAPVYNAMVRLYGSSTMSPPPGAMIRNDTSYTNELGVATFNYNEVYQLGQAGVAVLNIQVKKNHLSGSGIVKIEEEKTTEETVFIK